MRLFLLITFCIGLFYGCSLVSTKKVVKTNAVVVYVHPDGTMDTMYVDTLK